MLRAVMCKMPYYPGGMYYLCFTYEEAGSQRLSKLFLISVRDGTGNTMGLYSYILHIFISLSFSCLHARFIA